MTQSTSPQSFGITRHLDRPYDEVLTATREALKEQGFGVLTEVDVRATLKEKLGEDFRRYVILGACNPPLAHRALSADPSVGLLLPCNVVVYEDEDGGGTTVSAFDPEVGMAMLPDERVSSVAQEARSRLVAALDTLGSALGS
ncbi:MAG: DUF302 domain-containing protein [Dehalococcoidia bacterium]